MGIQAQKIKMTENEKQPEVGVDNWLLSLKGELEGREEAGRYRRLGTHQGRLDFSSNDYLSLNSSGELDRILRELITGGGGPGTFLGSTGSRLIRGHYEEFDQAEEVFKTYVGAGSALLFHSGYAANLGVLQALLGSRDRVFCDRLCHASILDGVRLSGAERRYFKHNDLEDLEKNLEKYATAEKRGRRGRNWIVTEGVFSMDGDSPDLSGLCELAAKYSALVYLDEAHSIGLLGPGGAGLVAAYNLQDRVAVTVYPCGKAPGLMGAFVCGGEELKPYLVNHARSFIFSTAQPPLLARIFEQTIPLLQSTKMEARRERIRDLGDYLRRNLQERGFDTGTSTSHIVPVILGSEERALALAARCQREGLDVRAIRPPSVPEGTSRIRITLQAGHTRKDLDELVAVLGEGTGDRER